MRAKEDAEDASGSRRTESDQVVAAFDFDGTLTYADSLVPFLRFAAGRVGFWKRAPKLLGYWLLHRIGRLDRSAAKQAMLRSYLAGWQAERLEAVAKRFAAERLPSLTNPSAMSRLRSHEQSGHLIVIVSASLEVYLKPWADANANSAPVLATRLREKDGVITGEMNGANCVGPEKVRRLSELLGSLDRYICAYGDSKSDLELLGIAKEPAYRSFQRPKHRVVALFRILRAVL